MSQLHLGFRLRSMIALLAISAALFRPLISGAQERRPDFGQALRKQGYSTIALQRKSYGNLGVSVRFARSSLVLTLDNGVADINAVAKKRSEIASLVMDLDTGSPCTALDPERTADLHLDWKTSSGDNFISAAVDAITIGDIETRQLRVIRWGASAFNLDATKRGDQPIDGILGLDVLYRHRAIIDYSRDRLLLLPRSSDAKRPSAEAETARRESLARDLADLGYVAVPLRRLNSGHLAVAVKSGKVPLSLFLDTGAPSVHLDRARTAPTDAEWHLADGTDGTRRFRASIKDLSVENVALSNVLAEEYDLSLMYNLMNGVGDPSLDGIFGADVLKSHSAVIDCYANRLYLRPADAKLR